MKKFRCMGDICKQENHDKCCGGGGPVADNPVAAEWECSCECHKENEFVVDYKKAEQSQLVMMFENYRKQLLLLNRC